MSQPKLTRARKLKRPALSQDLTNIQIAWGKVQEPAEVLPRFSLAQTPGPVASESDTSRLQNLALKAERLSQKQDFKAALQVYAEIERFAAQSLGPDSAVYQQMKGLACFNQGWIFQQQQHWQAALQAYAQAIQELLGLNPELHPDVQTTLMMLYRQRSQVYRQLEMPIEALSDLEQSAQYQQHCEAPLEHEENFKDWLQLAQVQLQLEQAPKALESLQQAENLLEVLPALPDSLYSVLYSLQAQGWQQVGQNQTALEAYAKLLKRVDAAEAPITWACHALLKTCLLFENAVEEAPQEAASLLSKLQELEVSLPERQELALPLLALAELCEQHQELELALAYLGLCTRALERAQAARTGLQENQLIQAYLGRARVLQAQQSWPKAIQAFLQARKRMQAYGSPDLEQALLAVQLGLCYQEAGKYPEAAGAFAEAVALQQGKNVNDPEDPYVRGLYFSAFLKVLHLEDPAGAYADLLAVEEQVPGLAAYDLACLSVRLSQTDQALNWLEKHLQSAYALPPGQITSDPDLEALHHEPRWKQCFSA